MAHSRIPGPLCFERQPWSLRDGTLGLWLSPLPGPVCAGSLGPPELQVDADVKPLFFQCLNPAIGLSGEHYREAAAGKGYAANRYDSRLREAHDRFAEPPGGPPYTMSPIP